MNKTLRSYLRPAVLVGALLTTTLAGVASHPAPSAASAGTDTLNADETLWPGQDLRGGSTSQLVMQEDGNLVLYRLGGPDRVPIWASHTAGHPGSYLVMQSDGNVTMYEPTGGGSRKPIWATDTPGHDGSYLVMQDDSNLVEYQPTGDGNRRPIWATDTSSSASSDGWTPVTPGGTAPSVVTPVTTYALRLQVAAVARAELSKNPTETRNNNVVRYNGGRGEKAPYNRNRSWCADFATWVWQQAGVGNPLMAHCGNGSAGTIQTWAANNRAYRPLSAGAKVGDLILYGSPNRCQHVAVVVGVRSDGFIQTIGGNEQGGTGNGGVRFTNWSNPANLNHGGRAYGYASPVRGS